MTMFTPAAAYRMVVMIMVMPPATVMMVIVGVGRCYRAQCADCQRKCE
jgi:hypothetical protein